MALVPSGMSPVDAVLPDVAVVVGLLELVVYDLLHAAGRDDLAAQVAADPTAMPDELDIYLIADDDAPYQSTLWAASAILRHLKLMRQVPDDGVPVAVVVYRQLREVDTALQIARTTVYRPCGLR